MRRDLRAPSPDARVLAHSTAVLRCKPQQLVVFGLSSVLAGLIPGAATAFAQAVPVSLSTRDPSRVQPWEVPRANPTVASVNHSARGDSTGEQSTNVHVQGLSGTLNKDDVHQTMEAYQPVFDACIAQSRRTLRWVSGAIQFAFQVDADGRVAVLRPTSSTIGHRELEQCLITGVQAAQFPKPSGRASAEFSWGMTVDPAGSQPPAAMKPKLLAPVVRKHARELYRVCEVRRRRHRFRITAYVTPSGSVLSAGGLGSSPQAQERVDCILEQVAKWQMPKPKHLSKLSFDLR
jgi:hypothetical protein